VQSWQLKVGLYTLTLSVFHNISWAQLYTVHVVNTHLKAAWLIPIGNCSLIAEQLCSVTFNYVVGATWHFWYCVHWGIFTCQQQCCYVSILCTCTSTQVTTLLLSRWHYTWHYCTCVALYVYKWTDNEHVGTMWLYASEQHGHTCTHMHTYIVGVKARGNEHLIR
jgi:hypothetical protein